ncbi:glycosyltransferase [Halobacillus kuroshimensis]|uniref:glycosyltransferase n=1 Tax=Halobacillus kuroshimensis TaxID=302481 RepID=UPI0003FCA46A|nr:glycosyltransferase [Halobacillus kuroshimensis]
MSKRVLVISNMYPSHRTPTYGIFVKNQVEALKEKGVSVDTAVNRDNRGGKGNLIRKYMIWILKILARFITKGRSYDVVHAHYIFPSGLPGLLFKKLFKTKLIVTSHGGDLDQMAKKSGLIKKLTKKILHEADHVIVVGEALKSEVIDGFGVAENKVSVINMGVDRRVFQPVDSTDAKKELGLNPDHFHILFVGNHIKAKGLTELLEAVKNIQKNHRNVELHLLGSVKDEGYLQELKESVQQENSTLVHFHGPKDQKTVATWMAAADVFTLPSYIEGFGLVALEAMSCHTPVVGSDVGGLSYLLADDHGVLVEPKSVSSLQTGLQRVMEDELLRKRLIENGEQAAEESDTERLLNEIIDLYNRA